MKSILKWLFIVGGLLVVLVVAAALIIPQFIDIKKYKPVIEEKVAAATGRTFSVGDDMDVSIFPWVGVKLTDIHLGNPKGYARNDMVSVKHFEVRLKVMPLLSKQIEVKTFVLDSPVIYLEKQKKGAANWLGIGQAGTAPEKTPKAKPDATGKTGLPIASLQVDQFSIVNGQLIYNDKAAGTEKQISDFNLELADISLDSPISVKFGAKVDGKPISLAGTAGPIGKEPGKGTMSIDFQFNALDEMEVKIEGQLTDPSPTPQFDMTIDVASFSPRKLMKTINQPFPVKTADPSVLDAVSLKTRIKGSPKNVVISEGQMVLDDSKLDFNATAKEFNKPSLVFDVNLDQIDLDRYLPEPPPKSEKPKEQPAPKTEKKKTDYTPLRKLVLDGQIKAGKIKAHGALIEKLNVHVTAKNGIIKVDPFGLELYQGKVASVLGVDVTTAEPKTSLALNASGIQVGPLLKDALEKEVIEGTFKADLDLTMQGDAPARIKQTLNGKGGLLFNDGAIIGIDIPGMVRNVKAKFGGEAQSGERPKTDFAELNIPFTAKNGLVKTDGTRMMSPLIRLIATGDIHLVKELLDMRVDPKFVATLKGQGDTQDRSGLMVPLLISGSFASPKIRPDLKGMIGGGMKDLNTDSLKKNLNPDELKNKILGSGAPSDGQAKPEAPQEEIKNQIKGLIPGFGN